MLGPHLKYKMLKIETLPTSAANATLLSQFLPTLLEEIDYMVYIEGYMPTQLHVRCSLWCLMRVGFATILDIDMCSMEFD